MKKTILGASILLSGAIIFLAVFIAASSGLEALTRIHGWDWQVGMFWSTVSQFRLTLTLVIAIIMMLTGIVIMIWDNNKKPLIE